MKRPKNPTGERFKTRYTCINAADADEFSRALTDAFPNVRFLRAPYWEYCIFIGRRKDGRWRTKRIKNEPPNLHVPYVDTMGVEDGNCFLAWLEPEGWEPLWFGPNQYGIHFIANEPKLWFQIGISREYPNWGHPGTTSLYEERIESCYYWEDKRHLAFFNQGVAHPREADQQGIYLPQQEDPGPRGIDETISPVGRSSCAAVVPGKIRSLSLLRLETRGATAGGLTDRNRGGFAARYRL